MERRCIQTGDGSPTISIPEMGVTYHSIHGSVQESKHVFIASGLIPAISKRPAGELRIMEMGFGTGLNALLTLSAASDFQGVKIDYTAIDLYPLEKELFRQLNYPSILGQPELQETFDRMHDSSWNDEIEISKNFKLRKLNSSIATVDLDRKFHLVYYDALAPAAQPELWTREIFEKLRNYMDPGGILVTYCSKGDVRRAFLAAGFKVEKLPGPPGKREMLRAIKV